MKEKQVDKIREKYRGLVYDANASHADEGSIDWTFHRGQKSESEMIALAEQAVVDVFRLSNAYYSLAYRVRKSSNETLEAIGEPQ